MKTRPSAVAVEPRDQLVGRVRRCGAAFVYEDSEFEVNSFSNLQPLELTKNWSDVVEFRRRKNQPSSCIHHRFEPVTKMCWDADQR